MAAAFNNNIMSHLQTTVRSLYNRRRKVGKLVLTYDEYLNTFVPKEMRGTFQEVASWMVPDHRVHRWELTTHGTATGVIKASLQMGMPNASRSPPPVTRQIYMQGDAPPDVTERIYHWAEHGGDASRDFARVSKVLDILNNTMSRVAIRYYWPTILAICSEGPSVTKDLIHELQDLRTPAKLKPLPPGLQQACRLAAETISTVRLLPADVEDVEGEVIIDIVAGQTYAEMGIGTFYGLSY